MNIVTKYQYPMPDDINSLTANSLTHHIESMNVLGYKLITVCDRGHAGYVLFWEKK